MLKKLLFIPLIFIIGCAGNTIKKDFLITAGSYDAAQIVIEGLVTSPSTSASTKSTLKEVDLRSTEALNRGRVALTEGNNDTVLTSIGLVNQAVLMARDILAQKVAQEMEKK